MRPFEPHPLRRSRPIPLDWALGGAMAFGVLFSGVWVLSLFGGLAAAAEEGFEPSGFWPSNATLVLGFLPLLVAYALERGRAWSRPLMLVPPALLALAFANAQVWRAFGSFVALTAFMALFLYCNPAAVAYYCGLKAPPRR